MSVLGIGLAFALFWSIAGVGAYLVALGFTRMWRSYQLNRMNAGASAGGSALTVVNLLLFCVGLVLLFEGFLLTFNVLFR